jgi:hypothetical protein
MLPSDSIAISCVGRNSQRLTLPRQLSIILSRRSERCDLVTDEDATKGGSDACIFLGQFITNGQLVRPNYGI